MLIVVGRTNVNPSAVDGEVAHLESAFDESIHKIGGIEIFATRNNVETRALDEINARIGVVVVGGFFLHATHLVAVEHKYSVGHRHHVGYACHGEVVIVVDVSEIEILEVDACEQVAVHKQHGIVVKLLDERKATDGAHAIRFANALHIHIGNGGGEVLFELLGEVVGGYRNVLHAASSQCLHIIVDDAFVAYFEQRFGGVEGERTQAFAFAARHKHGIDGQHRTDAIEVENINDASLGIDVRDESDALLSQAFHFGNRDIAFESHALAVHNQLHGVGKLVAGYEAASNVAVGERAEQTVAVGANKQSHSSARQRIEPAESLEHGAAVRDDEIVDVHIYV